MALLVALTAAALPAHAATVTLTAGDPIDSPSFNTAGRWSNAAAPSAANDYVVALGGAAGINLRTPSAAGNFTFAGNSLTLGDGGTNFGNLLYKGIGPATDIITINNLTVNGGAINNGNAGATFTLAGTLTVQAGGLNFGANGDNNGTVGRTIIVSSSISGPGAVNANSLTAPYGSIVFSGANTYTGGTNIGANATLRLAQVAALPGLANGGTPLPVTLGNNASLTVFLGGTSDFTPADINRLRANVTFPTGTFFGFDTTNATTGFTYAENLTGNFGFAKSGANTLFLTGANTYNGGTRLVGGTLNFANIGNLGTGPVNFNGGTLQFAPGNTADITTALSIVLAGLGIIDTNGNNPTFAGPINGTGAFTKTGAGNLTLLSTATPGNLFVRQGQVILSGANANVTTANYSSIGQLGTDTGTLTVRDGARLGIGGDFNVSDVSPTVGTLYILDEGQGTPSVTAKTLYVGKSGTASGVVVQRGGTMQAGTGPGDWRIGGGNLAADVNAVGTYDISGAATFTTTNNFQVGAYGVGQMTITGDANVTAGGFPVMGRFSGSKGILNVFGGTFTQSNQGSTIIVGESGSGILNVGGTGFVIASNGASLRLGNLTVPANPGVGIANLGTGGLLSVKAVTTAGAAATSLFNFHGGTLYATTNSTTFMAGLTGAYVYGEGALIDTNGSDVTIGQPLLAPAGGGVLSIPVTSGGAGYLANPVIFISGAGVGASAVPVLSGGVLTAVTITNPGAGYSAPTVTVSGGNPTTAATLGTPVLGSPASGALNKLGPGTLTLSAVNTYGGGTSLASGRLAVTVAGALGSAGNIGLTSGTTLDLTALGTTGFTLEAGRTLTSTAATVAGLLNVSGTYQSTGASALSGGLTVNSGGTVSASNGTLTVGGAVTNNGTIRLTGGSTLAANGATSFVNNGLIDLLGGSAQFPANFSNGSNGVVLTQGSVRVNSVSKAAGGPVTVTISSLSGFSYQLQRSSTLVNPNYVNVGAAQAGSNGTMLTLTDSAPTGTQAFYRVVLLR